MLIKLQRGRFILASVLMPFFTVAIFVVLFVGFLPSQAASSIYTVNSTADINDGSCNANNCTLREAILAANDNLGADIINFSLPPNSTIILNGTALPAILGRLTINGGGAANLTISGNNSSRIFLIGPLPPGYLSPGEGVESGVNGDVPQVTLLDMVVTNGNEAGGWGGAIFNDGKLTIKNLEVIGTTSGYGAIYNNRVLTVENSLLFNNKALLGGAIFSANFGSVTVIGSDIISNSAVSYNGGGMYIIDGHVLIKNSTFSDNKVFNFEEGGAVYLRNSWSTVMNSTFNDNSAFNGGAIYSNGLLTITNSTISSNFADYQGGGLYQTGIVRISNSTFSGNTADVIGGGIYNLGYLLYSNTIVANSLNGGDCLNFQVISSTIKNLVEDGSCNPSYTGDPMLGPLSDNGGPTLTHMPAPNSPVIDKGGNAVCESFDQRGWMRPVDGDDNGSAVCDIGAVEVGDWLNLMPAAFKP